MSISYKKQGGNSIPSRDKKGRFRFRKKGKQTKNRLKKQSSKNGRKDKLSKKGSKKRSNKSSRSKKLSEETNSVPIVYGHVYSNSCGHCVNMQKDWDNLVNDIGNQVELYDIGEDHSTQVRQFNDHFDSTLNFSGFPTVFRLSQQGNPVEYYDDYYKKQTDDFENRRSTIKPLPFRSRESMKVWVLGG